MLRRHDAGPALDQQRLLIAALVNDDRPRCKIAQPLMSLRAQHRDHANEVQRRQVIDDAQQVARHRFKQRDLAARVLDHAQLHDVLAGRLPVPEGLKKREVAPEDQDIYRDKDRKGPLAQQVDTICQCSEENRPQI